MQHGDIRPKSARTFRQNSPKINRVRARARCIFPLKMFHNENRIFVCNERHKLRLYFPAPLAFFQLRSRTYAIDAREARHVRFHICVAQNSSDRFPTSLARCKTRRHPATGLSNDDGSSNFHKLSREGRRDGSEGENSSISRR